MSLFQKSVELKYLNELDSNLLDTKYIEFKDYFGNPKIQENIRNSKEEQFQEGFLRKLFVKILGYTLNPDPNYNLTTELKNISNSKKADGAILRDDYALAVIELKSTSTIDLDTVESQAFGYKNHNSKCVYVMTSNFEKIRFYIQNATENIEFDLFNLSREQFSLLWLCLAKVNLLNDVPLKIKIASVLKEENVTKELYTDYSNFRNALFNNLVKDNPNKDKLLLFRKTQKLLDRFLFIFFAEDRQLLPPNSISEIVKQWKSLKEELDAYVPLYGRFKKYFGYLNTGHKGKTFDIYPYNGGLFTPDDLLDNIEIDDDLLYEHTLKLSSYDFNSEVDVNILGHIFEHSLNEIENVQAEIKGEAVDQQKTKRKKDGIFYTPKYITKYIVEHTVGKLCSEKRKELEIVNSDYISKQRKEVKKKLLDKLDTYREWLKSITILDPACGSGAFLNQALEFLIEEHKKIDELKAHLLGASIVFSDIETEILEHNLFGVDLNEESVEIAKLSLWLRTAQKGRKLNTLYNNIKRGNSLIDDPAIAGEKAFNWKNEFIEIFAKGGFDVVIGNPPWGAKLNQKEAGFLIEKYPLIPSKIKDTYLYFSLLNINLCKPSGYFGLIIPNTWLLINNAMKFREYILSYKIDIIIDHGDGVFNDAIVESTTLILQNDKLDKQYCQTIREKFGKPLSVNLIDKAIWLNDELKRIVIDIDSTATSILEKIESVSERFDCNCDIIFGIKPYQVGYGVPPQSQDDVDKRIYHNSQKTGDGWFPLVTGTDINRYSLIFRNDAYIKYGKWLMYPSNKEKINKEKLLLRRTSSDLRLALDDEKYYPQNSLFIITSKRYNLKFLLALLNSKLYSYIYKNKCPQIGKVFAEVKPSIIKSFPIYRDIESSSVSIIIELSVLLTRYYKKRNREVLLFLKTLSEEKALNKINGKLLEFYEFTFDVFKNEIKKVKIEFKLGDENNQWRDYFNNTSEKIKAIQADIMKTDMEIDKMIYKLYEITDEEIKIVEGQ